MKKIISQILVGLALTIPILAQENQPRLIVEFGETPLSFIKMYVENAAYELNELPNHKLHVKIYGGRKYSFASAYVQGSMIKGFWANYVKRPAEKLVIQFCNVNEEAIRTEFFAIGENDKVEPCNEKLIVPKETVLFETSYFGGNDFRVPEIPFNAIEKDYPDVEASTGDYSEFAQNILKKFLTESPESKVYVIGYLNADFRIDEKGKVISKSWKNLDKKSDLNKMFRAARKELLKNGFSTSQIKMIDGGYINDYGGKRLEFWFVPQGGAIPKPKPDYFPKRKRGKKK